MSKLLCTKFIKTKHGVKIHLQPGELFGQALTEKWNRQNNYRA